MNATHVADYNSYYAFLEKSIFDGLKSRAKNIFVNAKNGKKFVNQLVSRMDGEFMKTHLMAVSKRPRILVVAPSNAAVNVIAKRIMKDGFMDGNCGRYKPRLVRLGSRQDQELMSVSLTAQCDEYAALPNEEKSRRYRECTQNLDATERKLRAVRKALCEIEIHTQRCRLDFDSRQKTLTDRIKRIQQSSLYVDDTQRDQAYKTQSELLASTRRSIHQSFTIMNSLAHSRHHHK